MKILVAGATGNTGTRLIHQLTARGHVLVTSVLADAVQQDDWLGKTRLMQSA